MNGNCYFGKVIKTGHIYKLGYEKCTCPKVQSGQIRISVIAADKVLKDQISVWTTDTYGMCFGIAIASALHWDIGRGLTVGILLELIVGSGMEKKNIQKREEKQNERNI